MSSKIEVQLTQYTPLLHFQGQESGACLRASEVKPALDNFITAWLKQQNKSAPQDWIQSKVNGHTAYRYRMTFFWKNLIKTKYECNTGKLIESDGKLDVKVDKDKKIHKLFFGAMGVKGFDVTPDTCIGDRVESRIKSVFYSDKKLNMCILVPGDFQKMQVDEEEKKLSDIIKQLIPPFFALHCFGHRSNKGFGSFGVLRIDREYKNELTSDQLAEFVRLTPLGVIYYLTVNSKKSLDKVSGLSDEIRKQYKQQNEFQNPEIDRSFDDSAITRCENPIHYKPHGKMMLLIPQELPQVIKEHGIKKMIENKKVRFNKNYTVIDFMDCFAEANQLQRVPSLPKAGDQDNV